MEHSLRNHRLSLLVSMLSTRYKTLHLRTVCRRYLIRLQKVDFCASNVAFVGIGFSTPLQISAYYAVIEYIHTEDIQGGPN